LEVSTLSGKPPENQDSLPFDEGANQYGQITIGFKAGLKSHTDDMNWFLDIYFLAQNHGDGKKIK